MMNPKRLPFHTNLHRLAGLPRVLGIEIGDREIRAVEVERMGLLSRTAPFLSKIIWSYTLRLEGGESPEEIGAKLRSLLEAMSSTAHRAAFGLRPQAVRFVRTQIPEGVQGIHEWIEDNCDKLLQLPIPLTELAFEYRFPSGEKRAGDSVEIGFVRRAEVDKILAIGHAAGLDPVFVGVCRDAEGTVVPGDVQKEYHTTYALAVSAFAPSRYMLDFLPAPAKLATANTLWQRITKRVGAVAAVFLLAALLTEFLASMYVDSCESQLDESTASSKATVSELAALEKEVETLQERLGSVRFGSERTELARTMHHVASVRAPGIRFHRLAIAEKKTGGVAFEVSGEAPSHEQLAAFLSSLDSTSFCDNVVLLKSGSGETSSSLRWKPRAGVVLFDLEAQIR